MDQISHDVVYLDLVRHIKQYLDQFKCSFFDQETEKIENILNKIERDEELTDEELLLVAEHRVAHDIKIAFKNGILSHDSIILPTDKIDLITDFTDVYNHYGIYLLYESYYVTKFLNEAPAIIIRAIKLSKLFINLRPSQRVKDFCKEAYLTYINGNFIASAVLLRSIVETLLHEKLEIERSDLWKLNDLAKERGIYDIGIWRKVDIIRKKVTNIVHNIYREGISEDENRKLIELTQDVLSHLLS